MNKLIGFLSLLNVTYAVKEMPVNRITGSFDLCTPHMLDEEEVIIWGEMRGYSHPLTMGKTNELYFVWELPQNLQRSSFDLVNSIKLRFQYRIKNLSPELQNQEIKLAICDDKKILLLEEALDKLNDNFITKEISVDKENFLNSINNNNEYVLYFKTNAFAYKFPNTSKWGGLCIQASNKNPRLSPTLIFE